LVPAGDIDAAARALWEIDRAPIARLNEMGAAGQTLVRQRHSTADEVDRLERFLLGAAAGALPEGP
jgi:hypothetical protein